MKINDRMFHDMKLMKCLPFYLLAGIIALYMRQLCKIDDSDVICWILAPTSRWVSILSGIPFEYLPHMGYVNRFYRFLIAPACSGIRFMLLAFLMLVFSFLHPGCALTNTKPARNGWLWFGFSIISAYISTVFVNGIRISVSIRLPVILENWGLIKGWLTQERLHTIIGTTVYFSGLYAIYHAASWILQHGFLRIQKDVPSLRLRETFIPVFWYLFIVLAVPFLGRIYRNEWDGFGQYVAVVLGVCLIVTAIRQFFCRLCYSSLCGNKR